MSRGRPKERAASPPPKRTLVVKQRWLNFGGPELPPAMCVGKPDWQKWEQYAQAQREAQARFDRETLSRREREE
jgi:hypothetical protein